MATAQTTNPKFHVYKAPNSAQILYKSVFLAGSIEMGRAIDWQSQLTESLSHLPITILNPRRDGWDSSWKQDISNPQFKEQVEWELDNQDRSDVIAMFFDSNTQSPISLLELGLFAKTGKLVVCCPEGFWKRGNVQVVCARYKIELVDNIQELTNIVEEMLEIC